MKDIVLKKGEHTSPERGLCVMEAVAYVAGLDHTDSPACTCPVIAAFARRLNDRIPDDATRTELLVPLIPILVGTRSTLGVERKRTFMLADAAVRVFAPMALEAKNQKEHAEKLRSCAPIVDKETALAGKTAADASDAAAAAADAAAAAAYAADAASAAASYASDAAAASAAADARRKVYQAGADLIRRLCEVTA